MWDMILQTLCCKSAAGFCSADLQGATALGQHGSCCLRGRLAGGEEALHALPAAGGLDWLRSRHFAPCTSLSRSQTLSAAPAHDLAHAWSRFLPYLIMPELLQVRPLALQGDAGLVHPQHELDKVVCFLLDKHECCSGDSRSSGTQAGTGLRLCRCATLLTLQQCGSRVKSAILHG